MIIGINHLQLVSMGDVQSEGGVLPFPDGVADHFEMVGIGAFVCVYGLVWNGEIAVAVKTTKSAEDPVSKNEITVDSTVPSTVPR